MEFAWRVEGTNEIWIKEMEVEGHDDAMENIIPGACKKASVAKVTCIRWKSREHVQQTVLSVCLGDSRAMFVRQEQVLLNLRRSSHCLPYCTLPYVCVYITAQLLAYIYQ